MEEEKMWDWLLLLVGLLTAFYWYLGRRHGHWKARGVYTLPGAVPGVGHMWDVIALRKSPGWLHSDIYRLGKGHPAVGIYQFRQPALLIRDLDLINNVLISDFSSFHDNTMKVDDTLDLYMSKNPFVQKGECWKNLRQKLSPAFSPLKMKAAMPMILKVCEELKVYIEKRLNTDVDVNYVMGLFSSEVLGRCAFAIDGNALRDPDPEFYRQGSRVWTDLDDSSLYTMIIKLFPFIGKLLNHRLLPKDAEDYFVSLIRQAEDYRQKNQDKAVNNDFLNHLLSLNRKDPGFTLEDVTAQSLTFIAEGFQTTSAFASCLLYELTMHPDIQETLRAEVQALDTLEYAEVMALPFMECVFKETMRKYCGFSMVKECTKDCVLQAQGCTYPVTKGQHVILPIYAIHWDPEIYPDPYKFDPDRFLEENIKKRHPLTNLGFGAGPRMCLGRRFAICQVKTLVAYILTNFELVKGDKTVEKTTFSPLQAFTVCEGGIWFRFKKLK